MARADKNKLNLAEVSAIGIGGMIGGGIFAVLGLAIATAGHAVVLTLAGGGIIALLTGLSYAQGLHFRGDGGSFTYIEKAFSAPSIAGCAGWLLVVGYVGTLALYATAFADYGAILFGQSGVRPVTATLASLVLVSFLGINLRGARTSGGIELGVITIKLLILAMFAAAGFIGIKADHFVPPFDRGIASPLISVALIFVAFEGFELIPNAIDEMVNPERDLRRAIVIAVVLTTIIYIIVAVAAGDFLSSWRHLGHGDIKQPYYTQRALQTSFSQTTPELCSVTSGVSPSINPEYQPHFVSCRVLSEWGTDESSTSRNRL